MTDTFPKTGHEADTLTKETDKKKGTQKPRKVRICDKNFRELEGALKGAFEELDEDVKRTPRAIIAEIKSKYGGNIKKYLMADISVQEIVSRLSRACPEISTKLLNDLCSNILREIRKERQAQRQPKNNSQKEAA